MRIRILTAAAALLLVCSCGDKNKIDAEFLADSGVHLSIAGTDLFVYDPLTCQLGFNRETCEFRMSSDTMSDYVVATLSEIPSTKGQKVSADLVWTTERNIRTKKTALKVAKIEDGIVWLWNSADKIELTLQILD